MKKTLLATALIAGFAGVAHAESSVTLYGLIDAGYGYQHTKTKYTASSEYSDQGPVNVNAVDDIELPFSSKLTRRNFGVQDGVMNGSRWGLKGTEDLGNGTSAIFVLESGFNVGNGEHRQDDRLFGRQAYVGLSGESWGTFTLGRQYNAADAFVAPIDPFGTGGAYASAVRVFGDSLSTRYDNAIKYVSPNFSGFQFGLGLVHSDKQEKITGGLAYSGYEKLDKRTLGVTTGLGYTYGPLYIGASFDYVNDKKTYQDSFIKDRSESKTKAWNIGGTYDFDVAKLHLMYGGQAGGVVGNTLGLTGDALVPTFANWSTISNDPLMVTLNEKLDSVDWKGFRQHSWLVGLSAPVGDAGKVMFSYAGNTMKNKNWRDDLGLDTLKAKAHNFALGYRHNLSKRTSVYGVASYGWSTVKASVSRDYGYYENFSAKAKAKTTQSQAIIGLQHRF